MTRDEAVSIIARRLGRRTDLDADIVEEMQLAQIELEHQPERPWFLLTEFSEAATSAGEERVALPSDFLAEYEEGALYLYDATAEADEQWKPLGKESMEDIRAGVQQGLVEATGEPLYYSTDGMYFRLWPVPDAVYTLKMLYYAADTVLSTNVANKWLTYAPELLISETGIKISPYLRDNGAMQAFAVTYERAWQRLMAANAERKHANANYWMSYSG